MKKYLAPELELKNSAQKVIMDGSDVDLDMGQLDLNLGK